MDPDPESRYGIIVPDSAKNERADKNNFISNFSPEDFGLCVL